MYRQEDRVPLVMRDRKEFIVYSFVFYQYTHRICCLVNYPTIPSELFTDIVRTLGIPLPIDAWWRNFIQTIVTIVILLSTIWI
jgi:hypothetical protein